MHTQIQIINPPLTNQASSSEQTHPSEQICLNQTLDSTFFKQLLDANCNNQPIKLNLEDKQTDVSTSNSTNKYANTDIINAQVTYNLDLNQIDNSLKNKNLHSDITECDNQTIELNKLINQTIAIHWDGQIICKGCNKPTKKSYSQGYCYLCFKKSASCDLCMMQPHTCHFHLGTCRESSWADQVCFNDHLVYLTYTSDVKVGITRATQIPTRWLDQGALVGIPIIATSSRRLAGMIENQLSNHFKDKTNWRTMLKNAFIEPDYKTMNNHINTAIDSIKNNELVNLIQLNKDYDHVTITNQDNKIFPSNPMEKTDTMTWLTHFPIFNFHYPHSIDYLLPKETDLKKIPIKSLNLEKTPSIQGKLLGIKGQYLIFDIGVLNLRKYTSYHLAFEF